LEPKISYPKVITNEYTKYNPENYFIFNYPFLKNDIYTKRFIFNTYVPSTCYMTDMTLSKHNLFSQEVCRLKYDFNAVNLHLSNHNSIYINFKIQVHRYVRLISLKYIIYIYHWQILVLTSVPHLLLLLQICKKLTPNYWPNSILSGRAIPRPFQRQCSRVLIKAGFRSPTYDTGIFACYMALTCYLTSMCLHLFLQSRDNRVALRIVNVCIAL
jgi:hypothetical protein